MSGRAESCLQRSEPPRDDEPELVRAAAAGEPGAFARLYERHARRVARRLSHLVGPAGGVDDLLQETFLRALRALPRFRGESPFCYWLLRIAASVARDEQRRRRRSPWRLFAQAEELDAAPAREVGNEGRPDLAAVQCALARLSPRLRHVVVLFELEGLTLVEIADELAIPLHTAGSRLRRGRAKLRRLLERAGHVLEEEGK
jgi:RNA polymerase sigma-70 factor (ECF subfamily)